MPQRYVACIQMNYIVAILNIQMICVEILEVSRNGSLLPEMQGPKRSKKPDGENPQERSSRNSRSLR